MTLDAQPFSPLTSVYVEGKSVPLQALVGRMIFPGDMQAQATYDNYCQNRTFRQTYDLLPDLHSILNPPPRGAMGAKTARLDWDGTPQLSTIGEQAAENFKYFAKSEAPWEMIRNPLPPNMDQTIAYSVISGMLAGFCLLTYLALDTNDFRTQAGRRAQPSKNVVTFLCEAHNLDRAKYGKGRPSNDTVRPYPTVTESLASENWRRYGTVSHVWAAFLLLTGFHFHLDDPTSLRDVRIMDALSRPEMIDVARRCEQFMLVFFDGQQHGRVPHERITPLHVARPDSSDLEECGLPQLPEHAINRLRELTAQYRPD